MTNTPMWEPTMQPPWWDSRLVGFDLETTAPDPFEARIVSAAVPVVGGSREPKVATWLVDPGVEIPEEATAVHGITNEAARANGVDPCDALVEILATLCEAVDVCSMLVDFNARFDLTVLAAECRRHALEIPAVLLTAPVFDPSVIDKFLDRYRKSYPYGVSPQQAAARGIPSSRTLEGMCKVYGVELDGAHDAAFDAIAACRIAYRIGQRGQVVRRVRGASDAIEKAALVREWDAVRHDPGLLHVFQVEEALRERERFAEYKRSIGEVEIADQIESEIGWPWLELPPVVA